VFAISYSLAVAPFTLLSVACAERITAINSSNGVRNFSSVRGAGLCSRRRSKIARRFEGSRFAHHGAAVRAAAEALSAASSRCRCCARACRRPTCASYRSRFRAR